MEQPTVDIKRGLEGVIFTETYAKASLVVLAAAIISAFAVRRRIDRLDLIAVLKTRE